MKAIKLIITAVLLVTVSGGAYIFYQWSNQPSVTKVTTKPAASKTADNSKVAVKTLYFSSSITGQYETSSLDETAQSPRLLQMVVRHTEPRLTDQIAITISESADSINESSSVQVRKRNTEIYEQNADPAARDGAVTFIKSSGGYEKSVFWAEKGKHISVVGSATIDRGDMVETVLDELVANWRWVD